MRDERPAWWPIITVASLLVQGSDGQSVFGGNHDQPDRRGYGRGWRPAVTTTSLLVQGSDGQSVFGGNHDQQIAADLAGAGVQQ